MQRQQQRLRARGLPTGKGGSKQRFCMTGSAKAAGACTMSNVTATSAAAPPGSGAATSSGPANARVSGLEGSRQ